MIKLSKLVSGVFLCLIYSGSVAAAPDIAEGKARAGGALTVMAVRGIAKAQNFLVWLGRSQLI